MTAKRKWCGILLFLLLSGSVAAQQAERPPQRLDLTPAAEAEATGDQGSVQFIGTATVLIRFAGLTILTDPNFLHRGEKVHLGYGLTSERLTNPALELGQLPPIDLIVLSHLHEDHFDKRVQQQLDRNIPIVSTPAAVRELAGMGFTKLFALETWNSLSVTKGPASLRVTAMPARHGPPLVAGLLPPTMGSMLHFSRGASVYRMYISGDTMVYRDIYEIPKAFPDIDLALLHLGGTRILGLVTVTMDGQEGRKMLEIIAPQHAIPIHYNDYDVFKSPLSDFEREVRSANLQDKLTYLKHGESYRFQARGQPK